MMEWDHLLIIVGGSFVAGAINTLAGNGSAITLTILTELLNLPANIANGTNRVGILAQSIAGGWEFYKSGRLKVSRSSIFIVPAVIGAFFGVLTATWVSNEAFKNVFKFLLVFMLVVLLVKPERWLRKTDLSIRPNPWLTIPAFLLLGFYGGFIQMGMGIFFLAAMVLGSRYNINDSNAVKVITVGLFTIVVIAVFQWKGLIDWKIGGLMAIGQSIGGWLTARFAVRYEHADQAAYWLLVGIVVLAVLKVFGLFG